MKVDVQAEIDAPPDRVWETLGPGFGAIGTWCASVHESHLTTVPATMAGAPAAGRHCKTVFGPFDETFTAYEPDRRVMRYQATSPKLPFFVKCMTNMFEVEDLGGGRSRVKMNAGADMTQPFRTLMGPLMKLQMGKGLREIVEELKHYVETGHPHPRKLAAAAKYATKRQAA